MIIQVTLMDSLKKNPEPTATIIVPVLNAAAWLPALLDVLSNLVDKQGYQCIIIDSESDDETPELCLACHQIEFITIPRSEFDHGATRNLAIEYARADTLVYLSQDALPYHDAIPLLVEQLHRHSELGAAFGRQLPRSNAQPFEAHLRLYNYPKKGYTVQLDQAKNMGIKAAFLSNAFCAYKKAALIDVGRFPPNTIIGEDFIAGVKLLAAGYHLAYIPEAEVIHSHGYTPLQELRRYFDIGCMHKEEAWVFSILPRAEKEGYKYIISEWKWLLRTGQFIRLPESFLRIGLKWLGYKLGKNNKWLPLKVKLNFSMNKNWWK